MGQNSSNQNQVPAQNQDMPARPPSASQHRPRPPPGQQATHGSTSHGASSSGNNRPAPAHPASPTPYLCDKAAADCKDPACMHSQQRASSNMQHHSGDVRARAGKACDKGLRCTRQDCRFQHPPGWNPQAPSAGNPQPPNARSASAAAGNTQPSNARGGAGNPQPPNARGGTGNPQAPNARGGAGNPQPPNARGGAGNPQPSNARGASAACRHGMNCTRTDCRFQHPPEWNPHRPPPAAPPPPPPVPRTQPPPPPPPPVSTNPPAPAQPGPRGPQMCSYGMGCTRNNCRFQHPPGWDPQHARLGGSRQRRPSDTSSETSSSASAPTGPRRDKMCKYGVHCKKRDCYFQHPPQWNPDQAAALEPPGREPPSQRQCRHGSACRNPACTFGHPPDWDPPTENQALCVVKSHPLGKSLYNKMTGDGWYGDKLEKLNNKVGATVTYLELECRLRVQVPYDQAPHAQKCMNRAIDESRPRLSGESNELNVVGTTRVVVGRGGQVLCVLPGREVRAFDALLDHGSNGHVRSEDLQATKDIMGGFVTPNADGTCPRPSVQPLHGKMRITFHKPEDAQSALDTSPPGPWTRLKPFIQPPREGTVVKVLELKITYPLAVRPNRERQVVILQQLAPFEVRMHDIEMSRGNSETGTGTATVHMWSKSNADAALLHLQTYARRNNELASRPGELDVQLQSGFRVYVARKQYMALEEKLRALQSKQRNSISIHIKAPQHDRDFAVIELIKQQEDRPADKEDLLRARKDIEAVLRGVVIQLDRETMQALPTKQLKEQLETVEEEFGGQVAILTEMESSRVRLFGSTSLEDSSIFRANPLKEAYNTTTQLIESLKHDKQPSFVMIPPNTRNWLLRGLPNTMPALRDALQKQLGNAAGVQVDRAEEKEGGAAEVKLVGSPAANLEATKLLDDLQSAAGSSFFSELVDSTRPAPDTTCAICWGDIEPAERHLMEPCLHAYHKKCAVRNVKSALEERKLPVMCQHQGCAPQPVCMEDIKLLLGDNSDYEKLCTRALMLHVNQNPALGRCPTVNCKQVFKAHVIKFECNHCLETYCTQCNGMPRWHEGRTCQQFQEMISTNNKSEQWISQNTRKCGSCRAPFFKLDGCNHLQCGACKKDLCNLCGETFPDASTTYSHLRARHGGYFTAA